MTLIQLLVATLCVGGALLVLASAVAMLRARDALQKVNVLSPATGLGLPMIVLGAYLDRATTQGVDVSATLKLLATLIALLAVSSVASNVLARSAYLHGAPVDPRTSPHDLRDEPERRP